MIKIRSAFVKWILIICATEIVLFCIAVDDKENKFTPFLVLYIYPVFKLTLNVSQFMSYSILIRYRIESMNQMLIYSLKQESSNFHMIELSRMFYLRQIVCKLHDTVQLINDLFKWSISGTFSIDLFAISVILYHELDYILGEQDRFGRLPVIAFGLFLFFYLIRLGAIIKTGNSTAKEANQLADNIHRINSNKWNSDGLQHFVRKKLEYFRLE